MAGSSPKREGQGDWCSASISVNIGELLALKAPPGDAKDGVLMSVKVAEGGREPPSFMRSLGEMVPRGAGEKALRSDSRGSWSRSKGEPRPAVKPAEGSPKSSMS